MQELPMVQNEVHVTERTAWKTCRLYHQFSYKRGLVPLRVNPGPIWLGTGVHVALATYYKFGALPATTFEKWYKTQAGKIWAFLDISGQTALEEMHALGLTMMTAYAEYAHVADADWEVVAVEEEISIEVLPGYWMTGTLDLLVRNTRTRKLWVVDHKTCASFVDPAALEFDDQMVAYLYLVYRKYNEVPAGAVYSMLRKKIPAEPLVLKKGGLSKAVNIDTTPAVYRAAIEREGLDVADYADILARLEHNEFFRRETVMRTRRELELFEQQIQLEVPEMLRPDAPVFPTMTQDCIWSCQFRDLCRTRATGGDVEFSIAANYKAVEDYDARWLEIAPRYIAEPTA